MFKVEPTTFTVAELAARWQCTPRQVFERAKNSLLPLYFPFDGFAFDAIEERRRTHDEWKENQERDAIKRSMEASRTHLQRHAAGEVSEWEACLSDDDVKLLQRELLTQAGRLEVLGLLAMARQDERERSRYLGDLIATPETVALCERDGFASFPEIAYHPASKFILTKAKDGEYGILDGRMLRLGKRNDSRDKLTADDLRVRVEDVKAIEAGAGTHENPPAPVMDGAALPGSDKGGDKIKKSALIAKYQNQWPSVEADTGNASRTELKRAKLGRGYFDEKKAVDWARQEGKLRSPIVDPTAVIAHSILNSPTSVKNTLN